MMGDDMRPPWVVHIPNSSASDRSHKSLPSFESDIAMPPPLIAKTLPVVGSTAGEDQAMRCGGTSPVKMLYLCSHSTLPVSASKQTMRSCMFTPVALPGAAPAVVCRYTWLSKTTGADRPPMATRHARFSPAGDHDAGSPVSRETPVRSGPRHSGQLSALTSAAAGSSNATSSQRDGLWDEFVFIRDLKGYTACL